MVFDTRDLPKSQDKARSLKNPGKSRYEKQREEDVVRNARERGYLKAATEDAIWENIGEKCDLVDVKYLNMSAIHLHTVGSVDLCNALRICVLSSNYITNFEALGQCRQLLFLDLHDNQVFVFVFRSQELPKCLAEQLKDFIGVLETNAQITKIPGHRFWVGLTELQVVYLHNNGISKLEYVQYLASSPSLSILTLFDTPLSLKPNYRHHVVNSVWTLKALDNYVLSDEEIIEDASFGGHFATMHSSFSLELYEAERKERNFEEALKKVHKLIARVNSIQAKNSPVLVIQKYIRGFIARQQGKYLQDMRLWAAVSIQRFYRHYKGIPPPIPPPSSPAPSRSSPGIFDYDSYIKNMKTSNTSLVSPRTSEERIKAKASNKSVSIIVEPIAKIDEESENVATPEDKNQVGDFPVRIMTKATINLKKLETSTSDIIKSKEDAVTMKNVGLEVKGSSKKLVGKQVSVAGEGVEGKRHGEEIEKKVSELVKSKELMKLEERIYEIVKERKKGKYRVGRYDSVRVFFGPIIKTHPRTEKDPPKTERDPKRIKFRLSGLEPPISTTDPLLRILLTKREAGKMVRQAAQEHEMKVYNEPPKKVTRRPVITTDQRLFIRTHGTMGMACLRAVQQAYRDRERTERNNGKFDKVAQLRGEREMAKERVRAYKQEYQETTLRRRIRDGVKTAEVLKERHERQVEEHERLHTARAVTAEQQRSRQADFAFINDFACQQTSVANALMKHDRTTQREEMLHSVSALVKKGKESELEQHSLVKRYMQHRQLLRQAETAMAKAALEERIIQDTNQRAEDVKNRLTQIKSRSQQRREYQPVPLTVAPPQLPPLGVVSPDQMDVWDRLPKVDWQPRIHERTQSEPVKGVRPAHRQRLFTYQPYVAPV